MAKFLFFPYSNQLGTTIPSVTIANMLRDRGHEVVYASNGKYTHILAEKGFRIVPINEISYHQYRRHVDENNVDFYDEGLIHHFIDKDLEVIQAEKPDVIVSNNRPTIKISSQLAGVKLVTIVIPTLTRFYGHRYYVPENHFLNKILPVKDINTIMPDSMVRFAFFKTMQHWGRNFNKVLKYYKLPLFKDFLSVYEGDVTLINQTLGITPFNNLPNNYFQLEQKLGSTFGQPHDWLPKLNQQKESGHKIIFVSMGSSSLKSYPMVMGAVKELVLAQPHWVLISNHVGMMNEGEQHPRIYLESFINSAQVLPLADLVITHGGINTLTECIMQGKPVIGIPEQGEQMWNLKYGEYLGIAKMVSKFQLEKNTKLLSQAIQEVLGRDDLFKQTQAFVEGKFSEAELNQHRLLMFNAIENLITKK